MMSAGSDDERACRTLSSRLSGTGYRGWIMDAYVSCDSACCRYYWSRTTQPCIIYSQLVSERLSKKIHTPLRLLRSITNGISSKL